MSPTRDSFFRQLKENSDTTPVMTFSAIGDNNASIWGSMIDMNDNEMLAKHGGNRDRPDDPAATRENLELPTSVLGADVTWTTSDASVISETGAVTPQAEEDARAKLTATITYGDTTIEEAYKVTVRQNPYLIYGFDFETAADAARGHRTGCRFCRK